METSKTAVERHELWIGGRSRAARQGATFTTASPFDGSDVAEYANGDERDADAAILAARHAFDEGSWPRASARARHQVLTRTAALLEDDTDRLAREIALEVGKPLAQARAEVIRSARVFDYYAGAVLDDEGTAISQRADGGIGLVLHEAVGVVALITAWNFPIMQVAHKAAAALAAGCTAVVKPSHFCSAPALRLARHLHEAGLPDGAFNVISSDLDRGALVGQRLAGSHAVDMVAFTGSTVAGQAVMRAAAANTKRIQLELGGKSANIIFRDAPLEQATRTAADTFTTMNGQQCSAGTRLLVQRDIHEQVVAEIAKHARAHVLGDPLAPETTMGPLINSGQLKRVLQYIEIGRELGDLVTGGGQPALERACNLFVEPTIFDNVANASRLAQEEVFGPVLAVIPFDAEAEAITLANDSSYGLSGAVWTSSIDRALRVVKAMRTGKMFVNCYGSAGIDDMPHGGYKNSGIGRENARVGLLEYQELKAVQIKIAADE